MKRVLLPAAIALFSSSLYAGPFCMSGPAANYGHPPPWAYHHAQPYGYHPMARTGGYAPAWHTPAPQGYMTPMAATPAQTLEPIAAASSSVTDDQDGAAADVVTVLIQGMRFEPAEVTVPAGTQVRWLQADGAPHTVVGEGGFNSSLLQNGQAHNFTFDKPGTYEYKCSLHPGMRGKVVVEAPVS